MGISLIGMISLSWSVSDSVYLVVLFYSAVFSISPAKDRLKALDLKLNLPPY